MFACSTRIFFGHHLAAYPNVIFVLDSQVVFSSSCGAEGTYELWLHSADGDRIGYLQLE
jgi:hypothetical protein